MRRNALVVVVVAVLAVIGLAGPASADMCVGRQGTVGVCVEPKSSIYLGCWYIADDTCTPVYAPAPTVTACWLGDPSIIMCG